MTSNEAFFKSAEIELFNCSDATLAIRRYGSGPALIFIHGWPLYSYTWRHLLPKLAKQFTCYLVDLPGLGDSQWTEQTDFDFEAKARQVVEFLTAKKINKYSLIAHDTGATVARLIAFTESKQVEQLILFNTEIPHHRPPWIPFYKLVSKIPFSQFMFRLNLRNRLFIHSPMGFRGFYTDRKLLDEPTNIKPYTQPLIQSSHRMIGAMKYLQGVNFKIVDQLKERHKNIQTPVIFIWGATDPTFPVKLGEEMTKQFPNAQFFPLEDAAFMPHEEQPRRVLEILAAEGVM